MIINHASIEKYKLRFFPNEFFACPCCDYPIKMRMHILYGCVQYRKSVRHGSHWGGSLQDGLGDEWTCETTLASAYVLRRLSAAWLQLQMKRRKSKWK